MATATPYRWATAGDINAFFGLSGRLPSKIYGS